MGRSRPLFHLFSSFRYNTDDSKQMFFKNLRCLDSNRGPPRTSGIGSDRSANWATTTAPRELLKETKTFTWIFCGKKLNTESLNYSFHTISSKQKTVSIFLINNQIKMANTNIFTSSSDNHDFELWLGLGIILVNG